MVMAKWDWEKAVSNVPKNVESEGPRKKMRINKRYKLSKWYSDIASKFQRLSILSINEILTVGKIVKTFNGFFIGVKYIRKSVKKSGIPHLPKYLEHPPAKWDAWRSLK